MPTCLLPVGRIVVNKSDPRRMSMHYRRLKACLQKTTLPAVNIELNVKVSDSNLAGGDNRRNATGGLYKVELDAKLFPAYAQVFGEVCHRPYS